MSCEDCGDEISVDGDPISEIAISGDDNQIVIVDDALEISICDDDIELVEVDSGIVYFEEDVDIELVALNDALEVIDCCEQGPPGAQGIPGIQGIPGVDGTDGVDGTNGIDGADGADGVGVPIGGVTGQALSKLSNADYDTIWANFRSDYTEVLTADTIITEPGSYLVFNIVAPTHIEITLPAPEDFPGAEIFILNAPFGFTDVNGAIDGTTEYILPPNTFIGFRSFQLPVMFGGAWMWGSAQRAGIPFDLPEWFSLSTGTNVVAEGFVVQTKDIAGDITPQWVELLANMVPYDNAVSGLVAADVQAAIDEIVPSIPVIPDGTMVNDVPTWNGTGYIPMPIQEKTTTLFDETTTPGVIYIGKALPTGSAISEAGAVWAIKTIDTTADTEIKWADGVTTYTKIWDNRASYSYY